MTKNLKFSVLILLVSFSSFLFFAYSINKLEFPTSLLTHSLEIGQHDFLIGNQSSAIKFQLNLQDQINKSLIVESESVFENQNIDVKAQFTFNPLGQLFKASLNFIVNREQKFTCQLTGTKLLQITCQKVNSESPTIINLTGPINLSKKPDNKYLLTCDSLVQNELLKNLYIFFENMGKLPQDEPNNGLLNINLSPYPLLQTELTKLINDISKEY